MMRLTESEEIIKMMFLDIINRNPQFFREMFSINAPELKSGDLMSRSFLGTYNLLNTERVIEGWIRRNDS